MLFVTGITGHSGRWFLRRLEEEGYQGNIRCVMRNTREEAPEKYSIFCNSKLNIEFVVGDINDESFLNESLKNVDTILHIASITLSSKIVNAALLNRVNWAILVHTTGRYSKFKRASEGYIKTEDEILEKTIYKKGGQILNCTIVRPTMIYGSSADRNMYRLVEYLNGHRFFPLFGDGNNLMQPVHARDLGNAYYDILINPEKTKNKQYNLSGKEPQKYIDIINTICLVLKRRVFIIKIPIGFSIFAAKIYNAVFKNAVISVEQVMRMQEDKVFSHEEASKDFGFAPVSFEEGIQEEIREYLDGIRVDYSNIRYQ